MIRLALEIEMQYDTKGKGYDLGIIIYIIIPWTKSYEHSTNITTLLLQLIRAIASTKEFLCQLKPTIYCPKVD